MKAFFKKWIIGEDPLKEFKEYHRRQLFFDEMHRMNDSLDYIIEFAEEIKNLDASAKEEYEKNVKIRARAIINFSDILRNRFKLLETWRE